MTEQRYKAVLAVIGDGRTVGEVARDWGISRRTMHRWLARYEGDGLEGLNNRSHRPAHCPHQTSPAVEAMVLEMRRAHSYWGARRIAFELARKRIEPAPSESAVYSCLVRAAVIVEGRCPPQSPLSGYPRRSNLTPLLFSCPKPPAGRLQLVREN